MFFIRDGVKMDIKKCCWRIVEFGKEWVFEVKWLVKDECVDVEVVLVVEIGNILDSLEDIDRFFGSVFVVLFFMFGLLYLWYYYEWI